MTLPMILFQTHIANGNQVQPKNLTIFGGRVNDPPLHHILLELQVR